MGIFDIFRRKEERQSSPLHLSADERAELKRSLEQAAENTKRIGQFNQDFLSKLKEVNLKATGSNKPMLEVRKDLDSALELPARMREIFNSVELVSTALANASLVDPELKLKLERQVGLMRENLSTLVNTVEAERKTRLQSVNLRGLKETIREVETEVANIGRLCGDFQANAVQLKEKA